MEHDEGARRLAGDHVERALDYIIDGIRRRHFEPGQVLVARAIAQSLDISVAPVREALQRLAGEGVVELHLNRSPRVKRLSAEDMVNVAEVWEVNVGLTAKLAAERIRIRQNASWLQEAADAMCAAAAKRDGIQFHSCMIRYHEVMTALSGNPYCEAVRRRLHPELWMNQVVDVVPRDWDGYVASFRSAVEAVLSGDPLAAEKEFRAHIRGAIRAFQSGDETFRRIS